MRIFSHQVDLFCQDRIIARLQQPYSLDCIPVEAEYQVRVVNIGDFHSFNYYPNMHMKGKLKYLIGLEYDYFIF